MMERPLRVCMLIQAYLPRLGGAERQLAALAPLLRARGVDVTVITRRYPGLRPFERIDGVPVHRVPVPGPKPVASLAFTAGALYRLRRLRPDLIHAHELLSPTTTAVTARQWWGTPVVAKVLRGGTLGDVVKLEGRLLGAQRLRTFRRLVDGFIVISREIDRELAERGVPAEKRFAIPNGVDTSRFAPATAPEQSRLRRRLELGRGKVALFTGRLAPEKQVDRIIALWPRVRRRHADAQFVVVGTGPERERLERMAGPGVRFPGHVEDVAPYLRAADLFLLPSATEGLSNAMLEAMATGLPVIATRVGGAPDAIDDGRNGRLLAADDFAEAQWVEAIEALFANGDWSADMGRRARERVVKTYSLTATAEKLAELYRRVADRPVEAPHPELGRHP